MPVSRADVPVTQVDWASLRDRDYVLICADFPPVFDHHSGGLRLVRIIEIIGQLGWPLIFAAHVPLTELPGVLGRPETRARYEDRLYEAGVVHVSYGMEAADAMLAELGDRVRFALISFPLVARDMIPVVRARCPASRVFYDMVDFHALRLARHAALTGDDGSQREARMFEQIEVAAARATDATIAISEDERSAMLRLVPNATVVVLPNVFTSPAAPAGGLDGRAGLLFVGGFGHVPNGDAIRWFAAEIWPMIHAEEPDCRLLVVGSNPGDDVLALAAIPGVEVTGYVTDLEPIYARARVTIAPLRFGAGAKGKVGESLAHGVPVVATTIGAEGMGLVDGENVLVADTGTQFAAQVLQLMRSDDLWLRLSRNGVDHVARAFSPDAARAVLADLLSTSG